MYGLTTSQSVSGLIANPALTLCDLILLRHFSVSSLASGWIEIMSAPAFTNPSI